MANKIKGEHRLDLSSPVTAAEIGEWLDGIDERDLERSRVEVTLQFKTGHVGTAEEVRAVTNGLGSPRIGGLELVATWDN